MVSPRGRVKRRVCRGEDDAGQQLIVLSQCRSGSREPGGCTVEYKYSSRAHPGLAALLCARRLGCREIRSVHVGHESKRGSADVEKLRILEEWKAVGRLKLSVPTAENKRTGVPPESSLDLAASAGRDGWIRIINSWTTVAN